MKKLYFLSIFCLLGLAVSAQTTTTTIYATGAAGSYKTGYATTTTRTSNNIRANATGTIRRGYGVFSLATIPAGTIINSCVIGFNVATYGGAGTPSGWDTYGYAGDLSTVTTAATLYADCISGTSISTATYGTSTGNKTLVTTPASQAFISAHAAGTVSICWTGGNTRQYTITGCTGTTATTGAHKPYMTLQYCTGVSSVAATATPNPLCPGNTLTLTGSGTGVTTYAWAGPGGFTSTAESPTVTVTAASAGVYTFTAYNTGGCATSVTTTSVTVTATPLPVSGTASMCQGSSTTLSDATTGGTWSVTPASVATISTSGMVTGIGAGTATVEYQCGSSASYSITVNPNPSVITGADSVCQGAATTFSDSLAGGVWSSGATSIAQVNSTTGSVSGVLPGTATITYTIPSTTCFATKSIGVADTPTAIIGLLKECAGQSITLSDTVTGGVWSSANHLIASVTSGGVVTGITANTTLISYTNQCGTKTISNQVNPLPGAIAGRDSVCELGSTLLSDDINGGTWTSDNTAVATVPSAASGSALAYGASVGVTTISYTLSTGCYITTPFTVVALPPPISGPVTACPNAQSDYTDGGAAGVWSSDDTFVVKIDPMSGILTGVNPDTATIYYTLTAGCYVSKLILVNPLPAPIAGIATVCSGTPDSLSDDSLGGTWSTSDPTIATISSAGSVTGVSGGTVTISYTLPDACYITAPELIHPLPVPVIIFNGTDETFSTASNYDSYEWFAGPSPTDTAYLPGSASYNLAAYYDQYYYVKVTDSFGCTSTSAPYDMTNLSVKSINNGNVINVYPNPVTSVLYLSAAVPVNARISDLEGRILISKAHPEEIDISQLANGVYTIGFYDDKGKQLTVQKFTKQ